MSERNIRECRLPFCILFEQFGRREIGRYLKIAQIPFYVQFFKMCTEEASMSIKLLRTMHTKLFVHCREYRLYSALSKNPNFKMQKHPYLYPLNMSIPVMKG